MLNIFKMFVFFDSMDLVYHKHQIFIFSAPGGTGWTPRPSQSTPSQQTPNSQNTSGSQVSNTPSSGNVRAQLEDDFDDAEMLEAYSNIEEAQTS